MNHAATPEEWEDAWNHLHMHNMVDFFIFGLGLAARKNPEAVKQALHDIFTPGAVAHTYRRAACQAQEALTLCREAAILCQQITKQLDDIERRLDALQATTT